MPNFNLQEKLDKLTAEYEANRKALVVEGVIRQWLSDRELPDPGLVHLSRMDWMEDASLHFRDLKLQDAPRLFNELCPVNLCLYRRTGLCFMPTYLAESEDRIEASAGNFHVKISFRHESGTHQRPAKVRLIWFTQVISVEGAALLVEVNFELGKAAAQHFGTHQPRSPRGQSANTQGWYLSPGGALLEGKGRQIVNWAGGTPGQGDIDFYWNSPVSSPAEVIDFDLLAGDG